MGNPLISFRLSPEMVAAIARRYPDRSPSEGAKALILEALSVSASPDTSKPGLEDIIERLQALEARVFTPDDTPDDTLQTPELTSNTPNDTLLTPDDIQEVPCDIQETGDAIKSQIEAILAEFPGISLNRLAEKMNQDGIHVPGSKGMCQCTNQNIKRYLPDSFVIGKPKIGKPKTRK